MEEDFIIEVLDLFKSKLKNKRCTKQQTDAVYNVMVENLPLFATADEIAEHYGKSKDAVFSVIKRRMFEKPKRNITLYNFKAFQNIYLRLGAKRADNQTIPIMSPITI